MFFKPTPKYCVGNLVVLTNKEEPSYLLIGIRRWLRPNGARDKRWVYDGPVYCIDGGKLKMSTYISCVSEVNIGSIL